MRWFVFLLLTVTMLALQSALSPRFELLGARPDWLIIFVVFVALHARYRDALLAAWLVGALADLMTLERCGLIALSYLLVASAILTVRDYLFRQYVVTQLVVTLIACLVVHGGWFVYRYVLYDTAGAPAGALAVSVATASIYTALWAPPIHAVLLRLRRVMGLIAPRYGYAP